MSNAFPWGAAAQLSVRGARGRLPLLPAATEFSRLQSWEEPLLTEVLLSHWERSLVTASLKHVTSFRVTSLGGG